MRNIAVIPSLSGLQRVIPTKEWQQVIEASVARWNHALEHCCSVRLIVAPGENRWLATEDGVNVIVLRQGLWCHNETCGHMSTFPMDTLAMTTAYPEGAHGAQVREADVEVNPRMLHVVAADFFPKGSTLRAQATASGIWVYGPPDTHYPVPLEAVLVHELGHMMGLSDVCVRDHSAGGMLDIGECPTAQRDSVMFPDAHQLQPTDADLEQLAQIYPLPNQGFGHVWPWLSLLLGAVLVTILVIGRRRDGKRMTDDGHIRR